MSRTVNFQGNPWQLTGRLLEKGGRFPDFRVVSQDYKEVTLADFTGVIKIIAAFPSFDFPLCALQVKELDKRSSAFLPEVVTLTISKDLPASQSRFYVDNAIQNLIILSDYKFSSFGINCGLLVKGLSFLASSIFIVDKNSILRYVQATGELYAPLDYNTTFKSLEEVIDNPEIVPEKDFSSRCKPCEGGIPPLSGEIVKETIPNYPDWNLVDDKKISREFKFKTFLEAKHSLDLISMVAEEQGHHPDMTLSYNKLKVTLTTHSAGGLTENDFIMARIIDEMEM
ncbi:MAG: 4a-hydroxytetrahydrobiopterin dehydratase [Candidatus Tectomicrobia bacterium]|uniref:Putative pterin-4-alpha-carbinolamine dehydratase n=1 Tax=Tectimicrobiota bacterium TaxID=2528274 RepID=A0A932CRG0_UNCTE|nr:4a-hydroxytetrahydrobiopterin dehydratase [Candidatus Tectomicrobia bacterium]